MGGREVRWHRQWTLYPVPCTYLLDGIHECDEELVSVVLRQVVELWQSCLDGRYQGVWRMDSAGSRRGSDSVVELYPFVGQVSRLAVDAECGGIRRELMN